MSWSKKGEDYEVLRGYNEITEHARSKGIPKIYPHGSSDADFWFQGASINGEKVGQMGDHDGTGKPFHDISTVMSRNRETCRKMWKGVSEEIPGLKCYFCNSQAFKTDMPGLAVCGAAPAWFFFYRRVEKEAKTRLKVINGELQEVEEEVSEHV